MVNREGEDTDNFKPNALVINTSILRLISEKLGNVDYEILNKYALQMVDALIRSIRKMTSKIEECDNSDKTIHLQIRKTLGSLLEFVKKITASVKHVFENDLWFKIINL